MQIMLKGAELLEKWAIDTVADLRSAMAAVVHRGIYDFYRLGTNDLKGGRLGLKPLSKYRNEPKDPKFKGFKKIINANANKPLARLAPGITYLYNKGDLTGEMGFRAAKPKTRWYAKAASLHAQGYDWPVSQDVRDMLHRQGIHLRKGTTSISVPERDIIGAIKDKHSVRILQSMKQNFEIKKGGGRF